MSYDRETNPGNGAPSKRAIGLRWRDLRSAHKDAIDSLGANLFQAFRFGEKGRKTIIREHIRADFFENMTRCKEAKGPRCPLSQ